MYETFSKRKLDPMHLHIPIDRALSRAGKNLYIGYKSCEKASEKLCIDLNFKGSITLEAALSVPLFLLFTIAIISFMVIIFTQLKIQTGMEETARSLGRKAYVIDEADSFVEGRLESENVLDSDAVTLLSVGLNPTLLKVWLNTNETLSSAVKVSRIKSGLAGLYTYESEIDEDDGILDMVVHYDYSVPWIPESIGTIRFVQRMRIHLWTGESLTGKGGSSDTDSEQTVYITPTGTVYHLSESCPYLDLSIRAVSQSSISEERNKSGGKYARCTACTEKSVDYGTVYITDYGTNYHASLTCSGLKRTVISVDISEVGSRRCCSKCAALSENESN